MKSSRVSIASIVKVNMKQTATVAFLMSLVLGAAAGAAAGAADGPPATRAVSDVDHAFGLTLPDPYRWMEGAENPEFQAWLKLQGEYTRAQLDALPALALW